MFKLKPILENTDFGKSILQKLETPKDLPIKVKNFFEFNNFDNAVDYLRKNKKDLYKFFNYMNFLDDKLFERQANFGMLDTLKEEFFIEINKNLLSSSFEQAKHPDVKTNPDISNIVRNNYEIAYDYLNFFAKNEIKGFPTKADFSSITTTTGKLNTSNFNATLSDANEEEKSVSTETAKDKLTAKGVLTTSDFNAPLLDANEEEKSVSTETGKLKPIREAIQKAIQASNEREKAHSPSKSDKDFEFTI